MKHEFIYATIRQEILDQKNCQFQIFSVAVAITSGILAYAAGANPGALVFIAPMLINIVALWMVLEKAISVQRKVGYLQVMEQAVDKLTREWNWETHMDQFRGKRASGKSETGSHKHTYVMQVSMLLLSLKLFCAVLFFFGPNPGWETKADTWMAVFCLGLLALGLGLALWQWSNLAYGKHSAQAIREVWRGIVAPLPVTVHAPSQSVTNEQAEHDAESGVRIVSAQISKVESPRKSDGGDSPLI